MDTEKGASHAGVCWREGGSRGETVGVGRLGKDNMGRNARYRCWGIEVANHLAMYVPM